MSEIQIIINYYNVMYECTRVLASGVLVYQIIILSNMNV